jgi:hypothetical protein
MSVSNGMESAIESPDWQLSTKESTPVSLVVQQRACVHIFPWMRFVWAEGNNNTVKLAFASHMVTVTGQGLAALLAAVAAHGVFRLVEPSEREAQFGIRGSGANKYTGPSIESITVELFK